MSSLLLFTACLTLSPRLHAHAIVKASVPAVRSTVAGPDVRIQLRFNSRIDISRSRLRVLRAGQEPVPLTFDDNTRTDQITTEARGLIAGDYSLEWQVLGADGHITRGLIPFTVNNSLEH